MPKYNQGVKAKGLYFLFNKEAFMTLLNSSLNMHISFLF